MVRVSFSHLSFSPATYLAMSTRDRWPAWRQPCDREGRETDGENNCGLNGQGFCINRPPSLLLTIVGTNPTFRPAARCALLQARMASLSVMICGADGMMLRGERKRGPSLKKVGLKTVLTLFFFLSHSLLHHFLAMEFFGSDDSSDDGGPSS